MYLSGTFALHQMPNFLSLMGLVDSVDAPVNMLDLAVDDLVNMLDLAVDDPVNM